MRLASISTVAPGTVLARDISLDPRFGVPLLRAGIALTPQFVQALVDVGVPAIWVADELGEGIEPRGLLSERVRHDAARAVANLVTAVRRALTKESLLDVRLVDDLNGVASRIVDDVIESQGRPHDLLDLAPAGQYLTHHTLDTCSLGVLLGARYMSTAGWRDKGATLRRDVPRSELSKLALGLLLHDIGMLAVPWQVVDKPGPLDESEWQLVREHPVVGLELLSYETSFLVKGVVRSHQERWDGSGYPNGHAGQDIHAFARIAAVADVYDAVTAQRSYRDAGSPAQGWETIVQGAGTAFDPEVVGAFRAVVPPFPPGTDVVLADGRRALVSDVDLDDPLHPTVRVQGAGGVEEIARADVVLPGVAASA